MVNFSKRTGLKRQEKQRVSKVGKQGTSVGKLREQANTCQFWTRKGNKGS